MDNTGYLATSRAALLQRATDVTANNIANANTDGFRASGVMFESLVVDTGAPSDMREMAYAIDRGTYANLDAGALQQTSNPLDVALTGDGWFGFMTQNGQTALGRAGSFVLTGQGDLVTPSGDFVLDEGGAPINIPPGSGTVGIALNGTITDERGDQIARIGVFQAGDVRNWTQLGNSMLAPKDAVINLVPAIEPMMVQGFIEKSNVNPITEMTKMVALQRQYESAMNLANVSNELRKQTLSRLAPK